MTLLFDIVRRSKVYDCVPADHVSAEDADRVRCTVEFLKQHRRRTWVEDLGGGDVLSEEVVESGVVA